jgi:hypothetical protein
MDELTLVYRTYTFEDAALVQGMLEEAGIGVLAANFVDIYASTWRFTEFGAFRLSVLTSAADEAGQLVAAYRRAVAEGTLALEVDEPTVPPRRGVGEAVVLVCIWAWLLSSVASFVSGILAVYLGPARVTAHAVLFSILRGLFHH